MITNLMAVALGACDIIVIVCCAAFVVGVIVAAIVRKVKGKPSCGGDCGCCAGCAHCSNDKSESTTIK